MFCLRNKKIVNIILPISVCICFGCSKKRVIEKILFSTLNICFGIFCYALLTKGLIGSEKNQNMLCIMNLHCLHTQSMDISEGFNQTLDL